jgi:hypothetical protein
MSNKQSGNTLSTARNLRQLNGVRTIRDSVSQSDKFDFYRFTIGTRSSFVASVNRLKAAVNVQILNDRGRAIARFNQPKAARGRAVARELEAGRYFIRVARRKGDTRYQLRLAASPAPLPVTPPPIPAPPGSSPVPVPTPPPPIGNTLSTAFNIGTLSGTATRQGVVNPVDDVDIYRFTLSQNANLEARINSFAAATKLDLIFDANGNGLIDQGEILRSGSSNLSSRSFTEALPAGTYFVRVTPSSRNTSTSYDLALVATPAPGNVSPLPGNTLSTAFNIGNLNQRPASTFIGRDYVGILDDRDVYRFSLDRNTNLEVRTNSSTPLRTDLIFDANGNGLLDQGETLRTGYSYTSSRSFTRALSAGTYFVQVSPDTRTASSNYELTLVANAV